MISLEIRSRQSLLLKNMRITGIRSLVSNKDVKIKNVFVLGNAVKKITHIKDITNHKLRKRKMIEKFKKASNDRLINWIKKAGEVLKERGVDIRIYTVQERRASPD